MLFSLTIFRNIFDTDTSRRMDFTSWDSFVDLLSALHSKPGYKPSRSDSAEKKAQASPLISPAIYKAGEARKNVNVVAWAGWAAMDVDDLEDLSSLKCFAPYSHVCYNSASSTVEKPKCRIVLRLTEHVPAEKIRHFWYALNKEFNELGDPQTKDLSRLYYVPADYPGAYSFFFRHDTDRILNPKELMKKHSDFIDRPIFAFSETLPAEMQAKLTQYRAENAIDHDLVNKISWVSYRDCPFVNKQKVARYFALSSNWYHEMYRLMTSIASRALKSGYPITSKQIAALAKEIDGDDGKFYSSRGFQGEAERALAYVLQNM